MKLNFKYDGRKNIRCVIFVISVKMPCYGQAPHPFAAVTTPQAIHTGHGTNFLKAIATRMTPSLFT